MRQMLPQELVLLQKKAMLLDQFAARFPTEESCTDYFRSVRERVGVTCAHCKGKRHKWVAYRKCFLISLPTDVSLFLRGILLASFHFLYFVVVINGFI